jgi:hypothetical protein
MVASQGGPREHLARFRAIGTKWLHVVASVEHAKKARPRASTRWSSTARRRAAIRRRRRSARWCWCGAWCKAVKLPVVASGGVADGAGIAALLALGADAVQLGTRFIATPEASVHENYKRAVLAADVARDTLVGRGGLPIRQLKNASRRSTRRGALGASKRSWSRFRKSSPETGGAGRRRRVGQGRGRAERGPGRRHPAAARVMRRWWPRRKTRDGGWRPMTIARRRSRRGAHPDDEPPGEAQRAQYRAHAALLEALRAPTPTKSVGCVVLHRRRAGLLRRRRPGEFKDLQDPRAAESAPS